LLAVLQGGFNICVFRNKQLQQLLNLKSGQVSRLLKRLRVLGLVKKAKDSYKYYFTKFGKETVIAGLKIKELVLISAFNF
jgi:Mn-dependent DtxR family transcriptional regulator